MCWFFLWVWLKVKSKWEHFPVRLVCGKVCEAEILYLTCIGGFSWMFVWITFACLVPAVTKKYISWNCDYAWLRVTVWVQIIKSLSSEKIISALRFWAVYPAPLFKFYQGSWAQELTGYARSKKICNSYPDSTKRWLLNAKIVRVPVNLPDDHWYVHQISTSRELATFPRTSACLSPCCWSSTLNCLLIILLLTYVDCVLIHYSLLLSGPGYALHLWSCTQLFYFAIIPTSFIFSTEYQFELLSHQHRHYYVHLFPSFDSQTS